MGLLREIIRTVDDIQYQYTNGKGLKIIRKIQAINSLNRINKIVNKLNGKISTEMFPEYIKLLSKPYLHCNSPFKPLEPGNNYSTFEYKILETENDFYIVIANICELSNGAFDKSYIVKMSIYHNELVQITFQFNLNELHLASVDQNNRVAALADAAREGLYNTINEDVISFLQSKIENVRGMIKNEIS